MSCASWMGRILLLRVASGTKFLGVSSNHNVCCPLAMQFFCEGLLLSASLLPAEGRFSQMISDSLLGQRHPYELRPYFYHELLMKCCITA